jgi:integrase
MGGRVAVVKIRKRKYPSGAIRWELDYGLVEGKRKQRFFERKIDAEAEMALEKAKRRRFGDVSVAFSEEDKARFVVAAERLAVAGLSIEEAVEFILDRRAKVREPIKLKVLIERALLEKECNSSRPRYVKALRLSWGAFARGREDQPAHTISARDAKDWVLGNGWARKTKVNYYGDLRTLFAWGIERGHLAENPCAARLNFGPRSEPEIESLSVAQVKALVARAARVPTPGEEDHRALLWYVVLGVWCGLRREEMARLDRSAVDLEQRHVVIGVGAAKTRQRRVVDISANAASWLVIGDEERSGTVMPGNFPKRWRRLREDAGLLNHRLRRGERKRDLAEPDPALRWIHNALRHTFASYHYAMHQNGALLRAQMGHGEREDTLLRHYRGLRSRRDAEAFWAIAPQ